MKGGLCRDPSDKLIVALDVDFDPMRDLVVKLRENIRIFKVGLELFCRSGFESVDYIAQNGARVFLDLKFHDIPNTVSRAVKAACRPGVFMLNVHALGGKEMMRAAIESAEDGLGEHRPYVVAVTLLTSIDELTMSEELGMKGKLTDRVVALAYNAREAGLDGVVASAHEIERIRGACGNDFLIVTPGIRPAAYAPSSPGDQRRVATPSEAIKWGADFIVVGRPIIAAADPEEATRSVLHEIDDALSEIN